MKEGTSFELPKNFSQIGTDGELNPAPTPKNLRDACCTTGGFNRYTDEKGNEYFRISEFGLSSDKEPQEKQMVIAQLASFIVPVAPVFSAPIYGTKDYFSVGVSHHPEFDEKKETVKRSDVLLMHILFNDSDHDMGNHEGGIFYDFDIADISKKAIDEDGVESWDEVLLEVEKERQGSLEEMKQKVLYLKSHIEGESGLKFISDVCTHAGYTEVKPEKIQKNVLHRADLLLRKIEKFIG